MDKRKAYFATLSGVMLGLAFPPMPLFLLAFAALVPLLWMFGSSDQIKRKYIYVYITFFFYHTIANWWIASFQRETDPFLLGSGLALCFIHPLFFLIPFWFYFTIRKKFGKDTALWTFPIGFLAFEYLHSLGEASYPWLTLGYTQMQNTMWVQFIDITGIWGASLLVLYGNVLCLKLVEHLQKLPKRVRLRNLWEQPQRKYTISFMAILILPYIYGAYSYGKYNHAILLEKSPKINVALIQPNINPWRKWDGNPIEQIYYHLSLQDSIYKSHNGNIDLAIWSETAIPTVSLAVNWGHFYPYITDDLNNKQISLLTGFTEYYLYPDRRKAPITARQWFLDTSERYEPFNAALLLNPKPHETDNPQLYRKSRLTPFGERFPYVDLIPFAQNWLRWSVGISSWGIGRKQYALKVQNKDKFAKIGTIICIESIYPEFVTRFVRDGAHLLSVITNDSWYDFTYGPRQHYLMAAARAIETRRYIARCANSGVTGFISPLGKSVLEAQQYTATAIASTVPLMKERTVYVQLPDVLPMAALLATLVSLIVGLFRRKQ